MTRAATHAAAVFVAALALSIAPTLMADEASRAIDRAQVDRIAVRFWAPETGGSAKPRFITERVLAFQARLEALGEESFGAVGAYQERHVRAAIERHVAEELLAALMIEHGTEPRDFPKQVERMRAAMFERALGRAAFEAAMAAEGIDEAEVGQMLRRHVRAAFYVDRAIKPILHPTEEELREVFRTDAHPHKGQKLDDVREQFQRWLVLERVRQAESGFLQSARTRVNIVVVGK